MIVWWSKCEWQCIYNHFFIIIKKNGITCIYRVLWFGPIRWRRSWTWAAKAQSPNALQHSLMSHDVMIQQTGITFHVKYDKLRNKLCTMTMDVDPTYDWSNDTWWISISAKQCWGGTIALRVVYHNILHYVPF